MHKKLEFPIICKSPQVLFKNVFLQETELGIGVCTDDYDQENHSYYDAFDKIDLIPSIVDMVEKVLNGANKNNEVKKWVSKWGFLTSGTIGIEDQYFGQPVNEIWEEAEKLHNLWKLYRFAVNREFDELIKIVTVEEADPNEFENINEYKWKCIFSKGKEYEDIFYMKKPEDINDQKDLQSNVIIYILDEITNYVEKGKLSWNTLEIENNIQNDIPKITPAYSFPTLIDAAYMQFFIFLNKNDKRICPVCNTPFIPERKDKIYCSSSCKLTAKSQRYRSRKAQVI